MLLKYVLSEAYLTFKFYNNSANFTVVSLVSKSDFTMTCSFVDDADCDVFR
jgi:hypothetical protein